MSLFGHPFRVGPPGFWTTLFVALLLLSPASAAPTPPATVFSAEAVRAAYLVNFIRYTEWPDEPQPASEPFVIGFVGGRALEGVLADLVVGQYVRGRRLRTRFIKNPGDIDACHAIYFSPKMEPGEESLPGASELLPLLRGRPVLTISESPDFLDRGGLVNLYSGEGGKLRFEIVADRAKACDLALSSRFLVLARPAPTPADKTRPAPNP